MVISWISAAGTPLERLIDHERCARRRPWGSWRAARRPKVHQLGEVGVSSPSSMERTAFMKASSKLVPMDMTSPVAFIWVPMVRLA